MQLYALDSSLHIAAHNAKKSKNYYCPECNSLVRVRSGPLRQIHFYHLRVSKNCRQHQKSLEHLHAQLKLLSLIGAEEAQMECLFPAIQRIADVAWHAQKIVFEVQCSPIPLEEVQSRNRDYEKVGYTVIWILHDRQFNKRSVPASESSLRGSLCYYTNIDKAGKGIIYDQFEVLEKNRRLFKGPPLDVAPTQISRFPTITLADPMLPKMLMSRLARWKFYAAGDLFYRLRKEGNLSSSAAKMIEIEAKFAHKQKREVKRPPLRTLLVKSYQSALDYVLRDLL